MARTCYRCRTGDCPACYDCDHDEALAYDRKPYFHKLVDGEVPNAFWGRSAEPVIRASRGFDPAPWPDETVSAYVKELMIPRMLTPDTPRVFARILERFQDDVLATRGFGATNMGSSRLAIIDEASEVPDAVWENLDTSGSGANAVRVCRAQRPLHPVKLNADESKCWRCENADNVEVVS